VTHEESRDRAPGFELSLAPSGTDPARFVIESVGEIGPRSALETLRTFGLGSVLPVPAPGAPEGEEPRIAADRTSGEGRISGVARISVVRISSLQALRLLSAIRRRDPRVGALYARVRREGYSVLTDRVRGTVMRAYTADGLARGGGIVVELACERGDGTRARLCVSARERNCGAIPQKSRAGCALEPGERLRRVPAVRGPGSPGHAPGR
jgi:hypothetical protein